MNLQCVKSFVLILIFSAKNTLSGPDIAKIESEQNLLIQNLKNGQDLTSELKDKIDLLARKEPRDSLNTTSTVIPIDTNSNVSDVRINYTPPVIIMLPEDTTAREKWEYAVTLKCLGQENFDVFTKIHNTKILKMLSIRGKTVSEIRNEISESEKELEDTRKELKTLESTLFKSSGSYEDKKKLLHRNHNIKLLKKEIDLIETKLQRLHKRLKSALLFSKSREKDISDNDNESNEEDDESADVEDSEGEGNEDE